MTPSNDRKLWGATLLLAASSALVSACGPQDGGAPDGRSKPQAAASKPAVGMPAPARPAPEARSVTQASQTTGAVRRIDPITEGYRVVVQLDNGETRTFEPTQIDGLKVGDRVRVEQGHLRRV